MPLDCAALKICNKCGEGKPHDQFWADARTASGRVNQCKSCAADQRKAYVDANLPAKKRWYAAKKAKTAAMSVAPTEIACSGCSEVKSATEFFKNCTSSTGRLNSCKACVGDKWKGKYYSDPEYREKTIKMVTASKRKNKYGVSPLEFDNLLAAQDNKCAICLSELDESTFKMRGNMDHDHKTGLPRGILCGHCNQAVGMFKDSRSILQRAIDYLDKYEAPNG